MSLLLIKQPTSFESNDVITSHKDVASSRVFVQVHSLFVQENHIISRFFIPETKNVKLCMKWHSAAWVFFAVLTMNGHDWTLLLNDLQRRGFTSYQQIKTRKHSSWMHTARMPTVCSSFSSHQMSAPVEGESSSEQVWRGVQIWPQYTVRFHVWRRPGGPGEEGVPVWWGPMHHG